jgi:hypothetical protein
MSQRDSRLARNAYMREWNAKNRSHVRNNKNAAYAREPDFFSLRVALNKYGLTLDQYHAINEAQDFVCAICGCDKPSHIDHSHATGKVRGLLCAGCNVGIGMLGDNSERCLAAASYLVSKEG